MLDRIRNIYRKICLFALIPVAVAIFIQMLYVFINVFGRFTINLPVAGAMEASAEMMIYIVFLSIAYIQTVEGHVRIDFVLPRLGNRTRYIFDIVAFLIGIVFIGFIVWYATPVALHSIKIGETSWGSVEFPLYPQRIVVVLGSFMLMIQLILDVCKAVMDLKNNVQHASISPVAKIVENN
jgi:TRAP-type mannitol/chloroaromatic compound transport system permease small subunit